MRCRLPVLAGHRPRHTAATGTAQAACAVEYQPDIKRITGEGGVIAAVEPDSIAERLGLRVGETLVAVGDQRLRDLIDYRFAIADEQVELLVRSPSGQERRLSVAKSADQDLGIEFAEPLFDRLRTCNNKCPFCFLTQMPKGFRKTLYLKDDDYRLSFLYSNFVTFTNLSEDDWTRIERQRLSPMNISVHATDPFWRAVMLGKRDIPDVRQQIRRLGAMGIDVHSQIVACPGANDGEVLRQSIEDLIALHPTVQSIAVVPVGLTKYRFDGKRPASIKAAIQVHETADWIDTNWERQPLWEQRSVAPLVLQNAENASSLASSSLPSHPLHDPQMGFCSRLGAATDIPLRTFTPEEAAAVIDLIEPLGARCRAALGCTFVYASDEFYLLADRPVPPADRYDDMPQYSNGVGMVRDFRDLWAKRRRRLPARLPQPTRLALVSGTLVAPLMVEVATRLNKVVGLSATPLPVANAFFGETVTVSGLLTAQDVIPALRASGCDRALLPRVMFDYKGERTIDDYSLQRIAEESGVRVALAGDPDELVRHVRALAQVELEEQADWGTKGQGEQR
jgi:NifB/MoaA-like Fe-S oxidoreductase